MSTGAPENGTTPESDGSEGDIAFTSTGMTPDVESTYTTDGFASQVAAEDDRLTAQNFCARTDTPAEVTVATSTEVFIAPPAPPAAPLAQVEQTFVAPPISAPAATPVVLSAAAAPTNRTKPILVTLAVLLVLLAAVLGAYLLGFISL